MDIEACKGLPAIPLLDLGDGGPLALLKQEKPRAEALLAIGRRRYPAAAVRAGEALSRRWLARADNPYREEIAAVAAAMGTPGAAFLNINYEWGCTTALREMPRFLRVLDWPFDGLGANLVAARFAAPAGPWINLTWPGFVGVVQGVAPGRFAACFNQAPLAPRSGWFPLDWALERAAVWRRRALPPAHLLRLAFDTCADYAAARRLLAETPIALPAIFALCGARPGEGCVIERLTDKAWIREAPSVATNHWQTAPDGGFARGIDSQARAHLMRERLAAGGPEADWDFGWLEAPILNATTRLALVAEPGSGRLAVVGIEREAPATALLTLEGVPA